MTNETFAKTPARAQAFRAYWGERCDDFEAGCPCCDAWLRYDRGGPMREPAPVVLSTNRHVMTWIGGRAIKLAATRRPGARKPKGGGKSAARGPYKPTRYRRRGRGRGV